MSELEPIKKIIERVLKTIPGLPDNEEDTMSEKKFKVLSHEPSFPDSTIIESRGLGARAALFKVAELRRKYRHDPHHYASYAEIWPEEGEGPRGFVGNYFFDESFHFLKEVRKLAKEIATIRAADEEGNN